MRLLVGLVAVAAWAQDPALLSVKRVFVEEFHGGVQAAQIHDMVIASLQRTGLFALTEDLEKADAVMKGSAEDVTFTDVFDTSDGITARAGGSLGTTGTGTGARRGGSTSISIADRDAARVQERKHEAAASVRLVNHDGDILWSTTQESLGAKFKSSSADVADRIAKQLLADRDKLKKATGQVPTRDGVDASGSRQALNANPLPR